MLDSEPLSAPVNLEIKLTSTLCRAHVFKQCSSMLIRGGRAKNTSRYMDVVTLTSFMRGIFILIRIQLLSRFIIILFVIPNPSYHRIIQ
jgi:hypothetical protein